MRTHFSTILLCLLSLSLLERGQGSFHYWKSWARGYVRTGLGYTLPENADKHAVTVKLLKALIQELKMSAVQEAFKGDQVDTDLNIEAPANKAEVLYDGAAAELGNVLTPTLVQNQPTVTWPAEEGSLYTVLLTDPDAPSREDPKYGEWRHWLVVNVPGNNIASGEVQVEYIGAAPPKGTGLHRYILLVFKQPGRVTYTDAKLGLNTKDRNNTKTTDLAAKYNLGNPVAGNFFKAEYDDYVPKLYKKLSG